ncbi:tetratricopeptide repeat protein [Flavobacteriaceae bacterium S356]|uniref:Tetratricopeptide repeat protein n=1 Tax=Asprobacillus argus TaxID=3076534 RepID=A0ABU3LGN9_9FLAO|nr:tetratricopeptide repeat protein [Flavobacteriaceae bacterium S356]
MPLTKFESMLKTNSVYFFDLVEFEEIILHYLDTGKHSLAKKAVKLGLEQHPTSVDLKLLEVEILIFDNKLELAAKLVKKIEAIDPNNDEVYIQKATILSKGGAHKEAIENLKIALTHTNDKVDVWSLMGMEYLYLDDFENARLNFAKCIDVDFEDYSALYNVVYCFDMEKDHEQAIKYLNAYINKNPYCEVAWHQLGRQYFILNMFKEALTSFDYAVLIDESFIGGYLEKAKTLEQLERYDEAIENYLITLELDDPTAFAYVRIGECYDKLDALDTAIGYYKKAVHEDPLLDKGWVLLTQSYYIQEDYQKALYYINKALKIDEDNALYWRKYAEINVRLDFFEEAVNAFQKCIMLKDEDIEVFIALADVLSFIGEYNDALSILFTSQKIYKNFAEIEYRLAGLFFVLNKENHGIAHLKNGLAIDFEYHSIIKELYPAVFEHPRVQKLLAAFKKAME